MEMIRKYIGRRQSWHPPIKIYYKHPANFKYTWTNLTPKELKPKELVSTYLYHQRIKKSLGNLAYAA